MKAHRVGLPVDLAEDIARFNEAWEAREAWWAPVPDPSPFPRMRIWRWRWWK